MKDWIDPMKGKWSFTLLMPLSQCFPILRNCQLRRAIIRSFVEWNRPLDPTSFRRDTFCDNLQINSGHLWSCTKLNDQFYNEAGCPEHLKNGGAERKFPNNAIFDNGSLFFSTNLDSTEIGLEEIIAIQLVCSIHAYIFVQTYSTKIQLRYDQWNILHYVQLTLAMNHEIFVN